MRYAIITGTGRSGTNWLLDMFDASPDTHCRNEPHGLTGTRLNRFPAVWTVDQGAGSTETYERCWDDVAQSTASRYGARDHHLTYPKTHLHPWTNRLGLTRVMTGPRLRKLSSRIAPRLSHPEWELPVCLGSSRRLETSTALLKILIDAPLLEWLVHERPHVPVIHIVRHPGGRLSSWLNRLVAPLNDAQLAELHRHRATRLERIRRFDPRWREVIPEPSSLSLIAMELWFWRYLNESTMEAGGAHPSYRLVLFDHLAADPVGSAEMLYRHAGVPWTPEIARRVGQDASTSVFGAVSDSWVKVGQWRSELDDEHLRCIAEVMSGSSLEALFE